ncbi:MAG: hypothetical protein ACP5E3_09855, partial [Bacteroidales bacterium]
MIKRKKANLEYLPLVLFLDQGAITGLPLTILLALIVLLIIIILLSVKFYNDRRKSSLLLNQKMLELDNVNKALSDS